MKKLLHPFPKDWTAYFKIRFGHDYEMARNGELPAEFFPASTHALSQAVTCLYAMKEHGMERFSNLETLCIHIVGAAPVYEIFPTCVWEEISHCLPNVKLLKVVFVGPDSFPGKIEPHMPRDHRHFEKLESCPTCTAGGRKRMNAFYGMTYHDFWEQHVLPQRAGNHDESRSLAHNLIVALNTGMHEVDVASWMVSLQVIMNTNAAAFFTSYNQSEAVQDYAMLEMLGARMLLDGPRRNPFDDIKPDIDCTESGVDAFYHRSMYCMGFKGRR